MKRRSFLRAALAAVIAPLVVTRVDAEPKAPERLRSVKLFGNVHDVAWRYHPHLGYWELSAIITKSWSAPLGEIYLGSDGLKQTYEPLAAMWRREDFPDGYVIKRGSCMERICATPLALEEAIAAVEAEAQAAATRFEKHVGVEDFPAKLRRSENPPNDFAGSVHYDALSGCVQAPPFEPRYIYPKACGGIKAERPRGSA